MTKRFKIQVGGHGAGKTWDQERQLRILRRDYDIIVGIDPGTETGIAVYHKAVKKLLMVQTLQIHQALVIMEKLCNNCLFPGIGTRILPSRILVRVEDARLRKWIPPSKDEKANRGRNQGAGSVKRDCSIWEDFLTDYDIDFEMVAPATQRTKMKPDLFTKLTGWKERTSEHARDATTLCYGL